MKKRFRKLGDWVRARWALAKFAFLPLALVCMCGPYADPLAAESDDPACGTTAYAQLVAGYAIDLYEACRPTSVETCASIKKDEVKARWEPKFDAWARCGQ